MGTFMVADQHDEVWEEIGEAVRTHATGAVEALLFGSVARREDVAGSDVDIILVWPSGTDEDTIRIAAFETGCGVSEITGYPCIPLIFTEEEYRDIPKRSPEFADALTRDGICLLRQ